MWIENLEIEKDPNSPIPTREYFTSFFYYWVYFIFLSLESDMCWNERINVALILLEKVYKFFFKEFQLMVSAFDNSYSSSYQNINQFFM